MPRKDSVFYADPETFEALNQIRSHFREEWTTDVVLRLRSGLEIDVHMINDVVYHFHGHGTPEARCVVRFLEIDTLSRENNDADTARAQLFHKEFQKRGLVHVHISSVKIWAEKTLTLREVEELISEKWEH